MLYHFILLYINLCYTMSCYIMSCCVISCCAAPDSGLFGFPAYREVTSRHVLPCHALPVRLSCMSKDHVHPGSCLSYPVMPCHACSVSCILKNHVPPGSCLLYPVMLCHTCSPFLHVERSRPSMFCPAMPCLFVFPANWEKCNLYFLGFPGIMPGFRAACSFSQWFL